MTKSYLILLFVVCFLASLQSEAKTTTVPAETGKKITDIKKQDIKEAKIASAKKAKKSAKQKKQVSQKTKMPKALFAKKETTIAKKKPARKMVRLDFTDEKPVKKVAETKAKTKVAKNVKEPKRRFKIIACKDGHIVGQKAFCTDTSKGVAAKKAKSGRSLASLKNAEAKKLK